jgi:hypothetical protein
MPSRDAPAWHGVGRQIFSMRVCPTGSSATRHGARCCAGRQPDSHGRKGRQRASVGGHSPAWDLILVCVYDCVCVVWGWVGWATVTLAAALKARNRGLEFWMGLGVRVHLGVARGASLPSATAGPRHFPSGRPARRRGEPVWLLSEGRTVNTAGQFRFGMRPSAT